MKAYELIWDDIFLPLYGTEINLPSNTIVWRGFDPQFPAISDRPAYYGAREFAQGYADRYGTNAVPFITGRALKLLDLRFMKVLLSQLFEHNYSNNNADIVTICRTTVSFGICSLKHQVKLVKKIYSEIFKSSDQKFDSFKKGVENLERNINPDSLYEQPGYRIAETNNDAFVMGFLKELFFGQYDGYIAPKLKTPFHVEKKGFFLNSELVLFNPIDSGIQILKSKPSSIERMSINSCILNSGHGYTTIETRSMKTSYYTRKNTKGGGKDMYISEDYNYLYDKGDKDIIKLYNEGIKMGKKWNKKNIRIYSVVAPGPTVDPKLFEQHTLFE
jgi:hypothetical protein